MRMRMVAFKRWKALIPFIAICFVSSSAFAQEQHSAVSVSSSPPRNEVLIGVDDFQLELDGESVLTKFVLRNLSTRAVSGIRVALELCSVRDLSRAPTDVVGGISNLRCTFRHRFAELIHLAPEESTTLSLPLSSVPADLVGAHIAALHVGDGETSVTARLRIAEIPVSILQARVSSKLALDVVSFGVTPGRFPEVPPTMPQYGIVVEPKEGVIAILKVKNVSDAPVVATPVAHVYRRHFLSVETKTFSGDEATIPPGEERDIRLVVPGEEDPQSYLTTIQLFGKGSQTLSEIETLRYVVRGKSATFQDVTAAVLDVNDAQELPIDFILRGPADTGFPGRLSDDTDLGNVAVRATVTNPLSGKTLGVRDFSVPLKNIPGGDGRKVRVSVPLSERSDQVRVELVALSEGAPVEKKILDFSVVPLEVATAPIKKTSPLRERRAVETSERAFTFATVAVFISLAAVWIFVHRTRT
ncbi:MAG: hypothetical protein IT290_06760 [Deltaproteobacteria bacterium]|nr:hypothetical protein [Deltaproteobacteria bacterium]